MRSNQIKHIFTPPYNPASNGIAERAVQTFKNAMRNSEGEGKIQKRINKFLLRYRLTPHTSTGISPGVELMSRTIRSGLDCLRPTTVLEVTERSTKFETGETVFAVDFRSKGTWVETPSG